MVADQFCPSCGGRKILTGCSQNVPPCRCAEAKTIKAQIALTDIFNAGCPEKINAILREHGINPERPFEAQQIGGVWHVSQEDDNAPGNS